MRRLAAVSLLVAFAGCDTLGFGSGNGDGICTAEYRAYTVDVVGPGGAPATGLDARSVVLSTGAALSAPDGPASDEGTYYVATDGNAHELDEGQTRIRFTAQSDSLRASADYVFAFDGCHVSRVSGPSQITAARR